MAHDVTLMIASRGCSIFGSGTVSHRMSPLPCQQSAFMEPGPSVLYSTYLRAEARQRGQGSLPPVMVIQRHA